jgi:translocation and assembly module TamB
MIWLRVLRYFLMCVFLFAIGLVWSVEYPRIRSWLLLKVDTLSQSQADISLKAKDLEFKIFPPGVQLDNITLTPGSSMRSVLSPTQIDSIGVYLNISALLDGRLEIEEVSINHPVTSLIFEPTKEPQKKKHHSDTWDQVISIPIHGVSLRDADIHAELKSLDFRVEANKFNLFLEKNESAAKVEILAPHLKIQSISSPERKLDMGFMTRTILEKQAIEISALKIALGKNYVIARGVGRGDLFHFEFPFINGRSITDIDLAETLEAIHLFYPKLVLPPMNGHLNLDINAVAQRGRDLQFNSLLRGENLNAGKFVIGDFDAKVEYAKGTIRSSQINLHNTSGKAHLENVTVLDTPDKKVTGKIFLDNIELRQFLDNINVKDVPLHMDITGVIPCEGTLIPVLLNCAGDVEGKNFSVISPKKKTIVALDEFKITAQMGLDKEHVWFPKGLIGIGTSTGTGSGEVSYKNGFSFSFHTDKLDFFNVKNLADLKFLGGVSLDGTTSGTGKTGIIDAQVGSPQFWFENYGLGQTSLHFHYEKDVINFSNIVGTNGGLNYLGDVKVRVSDDGDQKMGVLGAHVEIPKLDLADLQNGVFGKKVTLPVPFTGQGSGSIDASGPFALSELTYRVKSEVRHVTAAGEAFDNLKFNVHAVNGHVYADDIAIKKGHGSFDWSGDVQPSGIMNIDIKGRELRIADFQYAQSFGNLDGNLDADIHLREFILTPRILVHGETTQMSFNQQALDDSNFEMGLSPESFKLDGQFFNQKVNAHLTYPFLKNNPKNDHPFSFKFNALNWDFSSFLGILSKTDKKDYETSLSAKIDIQSKDGDLWKSSGEGILTQFSIRHGNSQMKNSRPVTVHFDEGQVTVSPAHFEGDNTQFSFSGMKNRKDALNFTLNGQIDLSLLTFLTPFLRDMSGELSASTQIAGTLQKPDLLGSAFIKNGYFKLNALPQPFENINADMLFSQTRVLINHMKGHFAGGDLNAGGSITFNELEDIPVEITGDLSHAAITFPEGLLTRGDFHFGITGDWFPYHLKGDYLINEGTYTKEFGAQNNDQNIKRSIYLPKLILHDNFAAIDVGITTHFQKGIVVRNKLMDAEVRGELEITGEPSNAILKGDVVATPGGKVFFRQTPFTITEMKAKFNNPSENNPNLYVLATSRVRDYDITLLIQGTPQKYQLDLTSTPPLSNKSIVSLLALGVTEEEQNKVQQSVVSNNPYSNSSTAQSQGQVQTYEAGTLLLQDNPLKNELKERYGVDVRLSQTVDDLHNIVMPRVIAEKQWTPRISTSVSRTVGDRVTQDAVIEYKLDRHFSILGSFEEREYDLYAVPGATGVDPNPTSSILGMDLQFQVEFK